jgi:hypothetical protein
LRLFKVDRPVRLRFRVGTQEKFDKIKLKI